jgi:hypothetical protein
MYNGQVKLVTHFIPIVFNLVFFIFTAPNKSNNGTLRLELVGLESEINFLPEL